MRGEVILKEFVPNNKGSSNGMYSSFHDPIVVHQIKKQENNPERKK